MRIAAAQTPEFREDVPGALGYLAGVMEQARFEGASLLCLPEGFLQGYLTDGEAARRNALDLRSQRFVNLLDQLPERAPTTVVGLIEAEGDDLYNTAVVIFRRSVVGAIASGICWAENVAFDQGTRCGPTTSKACASASTSVSTPTSPTPR